MMKGFSLPVSVGKIWGLRILCIDLKERWYENITRHRFDVCPWSRIGLRLHMMRRLRLIPFSFIFLISIFIALFSAYLDYSVLADVDFPSHDRSFENPDRVDLLVAQRNEPKLFTSGFFSVALRPGINLLEHFSKSTFQTPSFDQETTILRC